jgi:hypothetical protein
MLAELAVNEPLSFGAVVALSLDMHHRPDEVVHTDPAGGGRSGRKEEEGRRDN